MRIIPRAIILSHIFSVSRMYIQLVRILLVAPTNFSHSASSTPNRNYIRQDGIRIETERWTCAIYKNRARRYSAGSSRSARFNEKSALEKRQSNDVRSDASSSRTAGFLFLRTARSEWCFHLGERAQKRKRKKWWTRAPFSRFMKSGRFNLAGNSF